MSAQKGNRIKKLNTGLMLTAKVNEQKLRKATLARQTGRKQSTITQLLQKTSVQVYVLWEFSLVMKHNFFADLAEQLTAAAPAGTLDNAQQPLTAQLAALEKENEQLRSERDLLKKVIDVLGKG